VTRFMRKIRIFERMRENAGKKPFDDES